MSLLDDDAIAAALRDLGTWTRGEGGLEKTFRCRTYADAVAAVVRLGFDAEAADHHPDLAWSYRTVTVRFSTHSEGGITAKDVAGAGAAERAFAHAV